MDDRKLGLRVYATAVDYLAAFALAGRLIAQVSTIAPVRECRVYPYPKFDDHFGLWLEFDAPDQGAAFDSLAAMLAPDWHGKGGPEPRSLIWDQGTLGGAAIAPEATWMHLELWGETESD